MNELPADDANSIDRQSTASSSEDLSAALNKYGIDIPSEQQAMLHRYCDLLWEWNQKLNLTRHTDFDTFVSRDLWDTVQLSSWIEDGERVLDVGSGGGVPGLVLAILRPRVIVTVSDSIEKKTRALEDMVKRLGLQTQVANSRVQDLLPRRKYDTLIARAVGPTHKILRWVSPFWSRFRRMLLIKGPNWVTERKEARHRGVMNDVELRKLSSYPMFGTESESVILSFIRKTGNSRPDSADSTDEGETR